MSCCGQKRVIQKNPSTQRAEPTPPRRPAPRGTPRTNGAGAVRVLYLGGNVIQVRGTYSGRSYAFSPAERIRPVDAADARVLLRTRFFRLADET